MVNFTIEVANDQKEINLICLGAGVVILQPQLEVDYANYLAQFLTVSTLDSMTPSDLKVEENLVRTGLRLKNAS